MIPFRVSLEPGSPIYEQIVYAAKKAILSGEITPGEKFPSVRALSQELAINPTTAHRVISELIAEKLLEVHPGLGTIVASPSSFPQADRRLLLQHQVEQLAVDAKHLGLSLTDVMDSLAKHWDQLSPAPASPRKRR